MAFNFDKVKIIKKENYIVRLTTGNFFTKINN